MRDLVREPIYASEETRLEWLRREFQRRRVHIAVILGPGHAFTGIVTLEDLLEEVVGEIQDEQDPEEVPPFVAIADGVFEADGRLTLDVAKRELGVKLPPQPPEVETLGGYVITQLAEVPGPGRHRGRRRVPLHRPGGARPPHPPPARGAATRGGRSRRRRRLKPTARTHSVRGAIGRASADPRARCAQGQNRTVHTGIFSRARRGDRGGRGGTPGGSGA